MRVPSWAPQAEAAFVGREHAGGSLGAGAGAGAFAGGVAQEGGAPKDVAARPMLVVRLLVCSLWVWVSLWARDGEVLARVDAELAVARIDGGGAQGFLLAAGACAGGADQGQHGVVPWRTCCWLALVVVVLWLSMPRWARSLTSWAALRRVPLVALRSVAEGDGALAAGCRFCRPARCSRPRWWRCAWWWWRCC